MILWQRQATSRWLADNEIRLEILAGGNLAVISYFGKTRSLVQVTCRRRSESERLVREFGGVAKSLRLDWSDVAQPAHTPIRIGRRLEIAREPSCSPNANRKLRLTIPAAGAFGTGEHATTAMSLRLLEETTRKSKDRWSLLDAGTGTGILALAARLLGACDVLGLDLDPRAVAHARRNARMNQITRSRFLVADVLAWKPTGRYEVVTANLFSELLIAALPTFRFALRSRGRLVLSGVLRSQAAAVEKALSQRGFRLDIKRRRGKWLAMFCTRKS